MINMKAGFAVALGCTRALVFCSLAQAVAPSFPAGTAGHVVEHWKDEFGELEKQIKETGELYRRGHNPYENEKILDKHSCILASDRTSLDVECRRTQALIDLLEDKYHVKTLGNLTIRLSQMERRIRVRRAESSTASRTQTMRDYFEVAALRRESLR